MQKLPADVEFDIDPFLPAAIDAAIQDWPGPLGDALRIASDVLKAIVR